MGRAVKLKFLIAVVFCFCFHFYSCSEKVPTRIALARRIVDDHIREMRQKHGMRLFARGGGFRETVNNLDVGFALQGSYGIEESRKLFISSTQDLLTRVNESEEIRPYLSNYPFNYKNLYYTIMFTDETGHSVQQPGASQDPNSLAHVGMYFGKVCYSIRNQEKLGYQDVYEEPYEEALRIVIADNPQTH